MKRYIHPSTQIWTYSQELMNLGISDAVGGSEEFSNYGSFDEDILMQSSSNRLWDDDEDNSKTWI